MARTRAGLAVAAFLVLAGCGGGAEGLSVGPSSERVTLRPAGSIERAPVGYVEYLPSGYGDGAARPLLVLLHGSGENGDGSEAALGRLFKLGVPMLIENDDWPDDRPFIVLMPQYSQAAAQECRLADEVDSFLDFALDQYDVDEERVYLTGVSCGAIGAWDYLGDHGDDVWAFHGGADSIVRKVNIVTPIRELEACRGPAPVDVRPTIYPRAGHDAWSQTYDLSAGHDIYAWLLGHEHR